jgi:hypothetical protein
MCEVLFISGSVYSTNFMEVHMDEEKEIKVPLSKQAIISRLTRKLIEKNMEIHRPRSNSAASKIGKYYIVDMISQKVVVASDDLEFLAKKYGVLAAYEIIE